VSQSKPVQLEPGVLPPNLHIPLPSGIPSRDIKHETCTRYRTYAGSRPLSVFHEYFTLDLQELCGTKHRVGGWTTGEKETWWDKGSKRSLFGSHLYEGEKLPVFLCEGETDAMALSQVYPEALCLAYGGKPEPKMLSEWVKWIDSVATSVTLAFDNDKIGRDYTDTYMSERPTSPMFILPLGEAKDVCQFLLEGGKPCPEPLVFTLPEFLLTGDDLLEFSGNVSHDYSSTGHKELDYLIGGFAPGKLIVVVGPPKSGKSSFVSDLTARFLSNHAGKVLLIPLELSCEETMQVLAAAQVGKHLSALTPDELEGGKAALAKRLVMMKHFGYLPIDRLDAALSCIPNADIKLVVLDHITAAATSYDNGLTVNLLDSMVSLIQARLNEWGIPGIVVSHTNASGNHGEIMGVSSIRGSQSLAQLASTVLGIRRLESGLSEVYTVVPDRFVGKMGRVTFEFDGKFTALNRKTNKL
jgi:RecA/RadA recombinase